MTRLHNEVVGSQAAIETRIARSVAQGQLSCRPPQLCLVVAFAFVHGVMKTVTLSQQ
jgi:hypothetical protein